MTGISCAQAQQTERNEVPKVYFTKEITPENLVKIYEALGRKAEGKVAVKLSTGEPGNNNYLQPSLIKELVQVSAAPSSSVTRLMAAVVPIRKIT